MVVSPHPLRVPQLRSLRRLPPPLEQGVHSRRQALLDVATTAPEIVGPESIPPSPPEAPVSSRFQAYGLPTQTSATRPMLAWNLGQALSLARLDATYSATNKFAMWDLCSPRGRSRSLPLSSPLWGKAHSSSPATGERQSLWCVRPSRPKSTSYSC